MHRYNFNLYLTSIGTDVWVKLHACLLALIPGLNRTPEACKKKFNSIFKQYKVDKMSNGVSGERWHECKFYDSIDQWWHQTGTVMKHVSASANDNNFGQDDSELPNDNQQGPYQVLFEFHD